MGTYRDFFQYVRDSSENGKAADNVPCAYLDSFHSNGQLFWLAQFSRYSEMSRNSSSVKTGYTTKEERMRLLQLEKIVRGLVNDYLAHRNITFQEMQDEASLNADEIFESAIHGQAAELLISKFPTKLGICFHVRQNEDTEESQLRFQSYTVVVKEHPKGDICRWTDPFDIAAFGDEAVNLCCQ